MGPKVETAGSRAATKHVGGLAVARAPHQLCGLGSYPGQVRARIRRRHRRARRRHGSRLLPKTADHRGVEPHRIRFGPRHPGEGTAPLHEREQPVVDVLRRTGPVVGILGEQCEDEGFERERDVRAFPPYAGRPLLDLLVHHRVCGRRPKRAAAGQQLVQGAAQRVQVGRRAGRFADDQLGSHVRGRPDRLAGTRDLRVAGAERDGEAEVEHADRTVRPQDEVGRLEVAVDQGHGVRGRQHRAGLGGDRGRPADGKRAVLGDDVGDADAVDVLHHQVRATVGGDAGVVDRRHAGMLKARGDPGFAVEAPHQLRVGDPVGEPDEFDRDAAVEPQIAGAQTSPMPPRPIGRSSSA